MERLRIEADAGAFRQARDVVNSGLASVFGDFSEAGRADFQSLRAQRFCSIV